ncbi:MAG TPA: VOC family protein [Polyangiaceae bacterium]|nr:VOC family protein [Polyangiaceae bacterium]
MPNPFVHIELNTSDLAASKKFYKGLFAWELTTPMPGYTMIGVGEGGVGGGIGSMPGAPTQWLPYAQVDSVKKTIAKARKRGATIVVEYQAIPNMGALGIFVDPLGATLGVWEVAAKPAAAPKEAAAPKKAAAKKAAPKKAAAKKAPKKKG